MMEVPSWGFTRTGEYGPTGTKYAPRDLRDIRMSELRKAAQQVATYLEENKVSQAIAEEVLDLIYAELNRRFTK
jgi:hypothetical protein